MEDFICSKAGSDAMKNITSFYTLALAHETMAVCINNHPSLLT
jgi:hypothetical protein